MGSTEIMGRIATIRNRDGIHCRPAAIVVKAMERHETEVRVMANGGEANGCSMVELLALSMCQGTKVHVFVEGPQAEAIEKELVGLLEKEFDFTREGTL